MGNQPLDRIHIEDLLLRCVIGIHEWERKDRQNVNLNITLHADLSKACSSDEFEDTIDYVAIKKRIISRVEKSDFYLVERLAQEAADACLEDPRVQQVDVRLGKPGALRFARTVAVEITRTRD